MADMNDGFPQSKSCLLNLLSGLIHSYHVRAPKCEMKTFSAVPSVHGEKVDKSF